MGESTHSAVDGDPEVSVDNEVSDVAVVQNSIGNEVDGNLGAFGAGEWCSEEEIFEIESKESRIRVRNDAVDE